MSVPKTHIYLDVDDASRSAIFYEALLGAPPASLNGGVAIFHFDSPPLVLTLKKQKGARRSASPSRFALVVTEPAHVGEAAIALRRAGVRLRVADHGIETNDPDGNAWGIRFVPSAPTRAVVADLWNRHAVAG